jgi:hypothetical protein
MEQAKTLDLQIKLNAFIIDIINKHQQFSNEEYKNIKHINSECIINTDCDCNTNIKMKQDMQHYIYFFLLEYIKLITSNKCNEINKEINNYNESIADN